MVLSNSKPQRSLLYVLSVAVSVVVSAVFIFYAFYSYQIQRDLMVSEIIGQAQESADRLAKTVAPYIESYEINEYEKLIETEILTENHYALSAIIVRDYKMGKITGEAYYMTGRIRGDAGKSREYNPESISDAEVIQGNYVSKEFKIQSSSGEAIGLLIVYVNDHALRQNLNRLFQRTAVTTVFLLLILIVILVLSLKRLLIHPLNTLSYAMSDRDHDGIPKSTMPWSPYKEVSVLSSTVNDMLAVIGATRDRVRQDHHRLENVINGTRAGTWYWNVQTGEIVFNERWAEILGYTLDELAPVSIDTWLSLAHPDDLKISAKLLDNHFAGHIDYYECEARMKHKQGHWVWVLGRGKVAKWTEDGEPLEMYGTHQDITDQKHDEEQLALAASVYKQVHEGILITNNQGRIVDVNDAFTRITGYSKHEAIGQSPSLLKSGRHDDDFYSNLWRSLQENGFWSGEVWNKRKNGDVYPELITISAVSTPSGGNEHFVALFSDITSIKEHEHQLKRIAHYDTLTGLPNRLLFGDRLRLAMSQAKRHERPLALLFLDLDGFKEVNDSYGHDVGDRLLVTLADRMSRLLREEDTLARLGGDEFISILPDIHDRMGVTPILERLLTAIAEPITVGKLELKVSASIGVALYPDHDDVDADQLIRQADQAMYHAKLAGKNRCHFFDPVHDRSLRGVNETISRLESALSSNEFELYYQPKVNLRTNEVIGVEGLIRWNHPTKGTLAPGAFLPAIEDHSLMVELGEWTLNEGLKQLDYWYQRGIHLPVSINIAAIHLQQPDFIGRLKYLLARYPSVTPSNLQIEVLESSALDNIEQVQTLISQCETLGIDFAIDDFGTGYSTLAYLKELPAQIIKIDQSFVRHMNEDSDDRIILEAVIGLAKAFKKQVIAEGLEDLGNTELLLDMGCECAQGYAIGRPMPARDLPNWLDHWTRSAIEQLSID